MLSGGKEVCRKCEGPASDGFRRLLGADALIEERFRGILRFDSGGEPAGGEEAILGVGVIRMTKCLEVVKSRSRCLRRSSGSSLDRARIHYLTQKEKSVARMEETWLLLQCIQNCLQDLRTKVTQVTGILNLSEKVDVDAQRLKS
jgi:hypothetical protein